MTVRSVLVATFVLLVAGASAAHAATPLDDAVATDAPATRCLASAAPPCGYIVPQITLDFPDKPACRAKTLGGAIDLASCLPLPPVGGTTTQEGVMRFSWDITQDGTYPQDPACATPGTPCITVAFSGTATNPKWMKLTVEPAEVVLDQAAFADPENFVIGGDPQNPSVVFLVEVPLTVTFERTDVGVDEKSTARIERAQGAVQMFLKAKSSASGQYFKEAFGVEEFRFSSCANDDPLRAAIEPCSGVATVDGTMPPVAGEDGADAPGLGLVLTSVALGAAAVALRRRA